MGRDTFHQTRLLRPPSSQLLTLLNQLFLAVVQQESSLGLSGAAGEYSSAILKCTGSSLYHPLPLAGAELGRDIHFRGTGGQALAFS